MNITAINSFSLLSFFFFSLSIKTTVQVTSIKKIRRLRRIKKIHAIFRIHPSPYDLRSRYPRFIAFQFPIPSSFSIIPTPTLARSFPTNLYRSHHPSIPYIYIRSRYFLDISEYCNRRVERKKERQKRGIPQDPNGWLAVSKRRFPENRKIAGTSKSISPLGRNVDVSRTRDDVWECESDRSSSSIRMEKSHGELAFDFSCLQEDSSSVDKPTRFASDAIPLSWNGTTQSTC